MGDIMIDKIEQENKIKEANKITNMLEALSKIDVFENTRKRQVVEVRSLLVYMLREMENMTYHSIKDFFRSNGKDYDHSTAVHAYKNYEMYSMYNKNLNNYFNEILQNSKSENSKKLLAKKLIDSNDAWVSEVLIYMMDKTLI